MGFLGGLFGTNPNSQMQNTVQAQQIGVPTGNGQNAQNALMQQLQSQMNGSGPNPAATVLQNQASQNAAAMNAQAMSQRGINPGLAQRNAMEANVAANQGAGQNAAAGTAQQALNAESELGSLANTVQAQNIGVQQANQSAGLQAGGINAGLASGAAQNNASTTGGLLSGGGGALAMLAMADGGEVKKMASGGSAQSSNQVGPMSFLGQYLSGMGQMGSAPQGGSAMAQGFQNLGKGLGQFVQGQQDMGALNDMAQEGAFAKGGNVGSKLKSGGHVPGKAKVKGDSLKNDNVKALLSPGEVVIPRSVMQSKDPARGAAQFVQAVLAKKGMRK